MKREWFTNFIHLWVTNAQPAVRDPDRLSADLFRADPTGATLVAAHLTDANMVRASSGGGLMPTAS